MTAALKKRLIAVDDYLVGELTSSVKHEYLGGFVYAMAGARIGHNIIVGNIFASLHQKLLGKRCQPFNSDTKIRVQLENGVRFYYPDASVVCDSNPQGESYQDKPVVIFETLSNSTRRIDEGEKKDAYLQIPSLRVLVLVEQGSPAMVVYRRGADGFIREEQEGIEATLALDEIGVYLPFAEVYSKVDFSPERIDEDEE